MAFPSPRQFANGAGAGTVQDVFHVLGAGVVFAPNYVPTRFSVKKDRNLNREDNFCGMEDVDDLGSKNRELHISGVLKADEVRAFGDLLDYGEPVDLTTPGWAGEVNVVGGEYEGPRALDPVDGQHLYQYSLDVVSTGRDEEDGHDGNDGVITDGTDTSTNAGGLTSRT